MPEQITTKPGEKYRSLKRPDIYEALRREGMSKERAARISNAQARKRRARTKSYTLDEFAAIALKEDSSAARVAAAAAHTPLLPTLKGQQLAPGVTRIHGDLCNVHGRWGSCRAAGYGGATSPSKRVPPKKLQAAPKPKAGGKKGGASKRGGVVRKPIKTDVQREQERQQKRTQAQQERTAEREQNRAATLAKLRNQPNAAAMDVLGKLERGEPVDPDMAKALADETGLVELHKDGTATLSSTGRAFLHALNRGDVAAAADAQARAQDKQIRTEDRAAAADGRKRAADERKAAVLARRAEAERKRAERLAKQGKGGGKGKKLPSPPPPRAPLPRSGSSPRIVGGGGGRSAARQPAKPKAPALSPQLAQPLIDAAQALSEGRELDETTEALLIRNGLARRNKDGLLILTAAGQRATMKEARQQPIPLLAHNTDNNAVQLVWGDTAHSSRIAQSSRRQVASHNELQQSAWAPPATDSTTSFAVFKDAAGAWRWVSRTTTAFEDRDEEVISTKALEADCLRADADHLYGPLRWWHVGRPDPLNTEAPWGPGIDLGQCDFNAVSGRTLIESGTFKDASIALAVAAKASDLELSPGFFHAIGEPDASGVFHHIRRFERSLVPKWAGRASNPYTGLVVEKTMDQNKIDALKTLGVPEATVKELIANVERTEKEADASNVRYKESGGLLDLFSRLLRGEQVAVKEGKEEEAAPIAEPVPPDPLTVLKEELAALRAEIATLKAEPAAGVEEIETQADEMVEEEVSADGLTLSQEDLDAIGRVLSVAYAPVLEKLDALIGAVGIVQKLEGGMGELKSLMGSYTKTKDDADAARSDQVAAMKAAIDQQETAITQQRAQLAELLGDQPSGAGYRPTHAADNTAAALLSAVKEGPDGAPAGAFDDLIKNLFPGLAQGGT